MRSYHVTLSQLHSHLLWSRRPCCISACMHWSAVNLGLPHAISSLCFGATAERGAVSHPQEYGAAARPLTPLSPARPRSHLPGQVVRQAALHVNAGQLLQFPHLRARQRGRGQRSQRRQMIDSAQASEVRCAHSVGKLQAELASITAACMPAGGESRPVLQPWKAKPCGSGITHPCCGPLALLRHLLGNIGPLGVTL